MDNENRRFFNEDSSQEKHSIVYLEKTISPDELVDSDVEPSMCMSEIGNIVSEEPFYVIIIAMKNILDTINYFLFDDTTLVVNLSDDSSLIDEIQDIFWIGEVEQLEDRATPNDIWGYIQGLEGEMGDEKIYETLMYYTEESRKDWVEKGWIEKIKKNNFYFSKVFLVFKK